MIEIGRFAAFCSGGRGGNPAGVAICDALPDAGSMQRIAAEVGYSETAFAAPSGDGWRVRYFAPEIEVPFCGHAMIALGAALAAMNGDGVFGLRLNDAEISVEGRADRSDMFAALSSPPTRSETADPALLDKALALFGWEPDALDPRFPPAVVDAGARHLALALGDRRRLAAMRYDLNDGRELMLANGLATISLLQAEAPDLFHARNAFAAGGVYEDSATGAAAAAWAGYLRDFGGPHIETIEIIQGEDMGAPCRILAQSTPELGASVRVSGAVRRIGAGG